MMGLMCVIIASVVICMVNADVYMHYPRGSNNRNNENTRNRQNGNRLFDSQNNDRGGYNKGGKGQEIAEPMKYMVGSYLRIEWTNQHQCNGSNTHCDIVIQYMCDTHLRDGTTTGTLPNLLNYDDFYREARRFGRHEDQLSIAECKTRQRNGGLYHGDQTLAGKSARFTRQNPGGTIRGLECPEERDYYPYWGPSVWRDVAILTSDTSRCEYYRNESMNVKGRGYCTWKSLSLLKRNENGQIVTPMNKNACEKDPRFYWKVLDPHGLPKPECRTPPESRDNHLGNTPSGDTVGSGSIPQTASYLWKIPNTPAASCALRLRYNISVGDYKPFDTDGDSDTPKGHDCISRIPIGKQNGIGSEKEAGRRGYKMKNNPVIKPLKIDGEVEDKLELRLAINTAQTGRVFQDRSHRFSIIPRAGDIPDDAVIRNLGVRGKRGNIVQVYPGVEYDFTPNNLQVAEGDYVHAQWTGALTYGNNDDGEGAKGTDKSNIIMLNPRQHGGPQPNGVNGYPSNSYPQKITDATFLDLGVEYAASAALPKSPLRKEISENQRATIRCEGGLKLNILSAIYGREPICASTTSDQEVKIECNGKVECALHASNGVYGDPCYGVHKNLVVKYECTSTAATTTVAQTPTASPDVGKGWKSVQGRLKQISVGNDGNIWGVNSADQIYRRTGVSVTNPYGTGWSNIAGRLKFVAVNDGKVMGVDSADAIYFREGVSVTSPSGSEWEQLNDGRLKQIAVGDGKIMGVDEDNIIYYREGVNDANPSGTEWKTIPGVLKYIAVGDGKIMGIGYGDDIKYRIGISDANPFGTDWKTLDGRLKQIHVGNGKIVGVNFDHYIVARRGIDESRPFGTEWEQIDGRLKHITADAGKIMGVNKDDVIYERTGIKQAAELKKASGSSTEGSTTSTAGSTTSATVQFSSKGASKGRCGKKFLAPDGTPYGCNPTGNSPCCSKWGWCGKTAGHCNCDECVDYKTTAGDEMVTKEKDSTKDLIQELDELQDVLDDSLGKLGKLRVRRGANQQQQQNGDNLLNNSPYYVNMQPQKVTKCATYHYMCTRNNNFSNRSHKGKVTVVCGGTGTGDTTTAVQSLLDN